MEIRQPDFCESISSRIEMMMQFQQPPKTIWILCGGPSSEYEVSISSGKVVTEQISAKGRVVRPVIVSRSGKWIVSDRVITEKDNDRAWIDDFFKKADAEWENDGVGLVDALKAMLDDHIDCAFLVFHGNYGEDGGIQGTLQTAGIKYTGSQILATAASLNKNVTLATLAQAGLKTAKSVTVTRDNPTSEALKDLKLPVFTKPVRGGSSLGVSLVKTSEDIDAGIAHALEFDYYAMIEEKIEGVEVSCGVVDLVVDGEIITQAMPPTLISPLEAEFFDYEAKYVAGKSHDVTPAPLPSDVIERIQQAAMAAHLAMACEGMSRTDMIVKPESGAVPVMLEIQTLPGMTPTSLLPQQCAAVNISFSELIDHLIAYTALRGTK